MAYKVALVDDHRLFREGLRALLASQPDLQVVGEAAEPEEACALVDSEDPDLVVVDLRLRRGDAPTESPLNRLTRREREVFDLIVVGGTTAGIATQLAISHRTVE